MSKTSKAERRRSAARADSAERAQQTQRVQQERRPAGVTREAPAPAAPDGFELGLPPPLPLGDLPDDKARGELAEVLSQRGEHTKLPRAQAERLSFTELAALDVPVLHDLVCTQLRELKPQPTPDDPSIWLVRKNLVRLRNHLDIFATAYPAAPCTALRKQLDALYEALGTLKDITHVELAPAGIGWVSTATAGPREALEREVLPSLQRTIASAAAEIVAHAEPTRAMLASPKMKNVGQTRPGTRFAWSGVKPNPKKGKSGLQNVRRLMRAQVKLAQRELKLAEKLDSPLGKKPERQLHDVRKRLRALINYSTYFPDVYASAEVGVALVTKLYTATYEYGLVQDNLARAHLAKALGDATDAQTAELTASARWPTLKAWQKDQKLTEVLSQLEAALGV